MYTQCFSFHNLIYREVDENDSDVDVGDEEDDLLADGEGIPEDEVDEVEQQE